MNIFGLFNKPACENEGKCRVKVRRVEFVAGKGAASSRVRAFLARKSLENGIM